MAHDDDVQKKSCSQKCNETMAFIWNSDKKEFLGRTGGSWAKIGLFYLVFYSCLAGFFAVMLTVFFTTVDDNEPTQQGMYSLIKGNPGMGFRPMISVESTLIRFKANDSVSYKDHVEQLNDLLKPYETQPENAIECSDSNRPEKNDKRVCQFNMTQLGTHCNAENSYGYKAGKPCILLKVNKVFGWQPEPFDNSSLADEDNELAQEAKKLVGDRMDSSHIGISCEGENEGDQDNILSVKYYPASGFSYDFFPYYNHPNYVQPIVFVEFDVRKGALIQVWCKLWAKNIKHHKNDKAGSTHFELLVDS